MEIQGIRREGPPDQPGQERRQAGGEYKEHQGSKEGTEVFETVVDSSFPERGPLPIDSGSSQAKFRITYLKVVAKQISWEFIEHAPDDSIQDSRIEK